MKDNEQLHKIIKSKLESYQPPFEDSDWQLMQKRLKQDNFYSNLKIASVVAGLVVILSVGITLNNNKTNSKGIQTELKTSSKDYLTTNNPIKDKPKDETKTTIHTTKQIVKSPETKLEINDETSLPLTVSTQLSETPNNEPIDLEINRIIGKNLEFSSQYQQVLAEKEIRFLAANATSTSDKISKVRALGRTFELTTYQALDRNIEKWKNIVIVCDITSSMFVYTTQLFDWMSENKDNTTIKGIVFFTDCDSLGNQKKGRMPAKMFSVRDKNEDMLWNTMFSAINNSENNKDKPENNLEAVLYAINNFKDIDEVVMIADNSSPVKDIDLLSKIKKPIHLILCGETYNRKLAFQEDYLKIAKKTKGSIHTLEDDIQDVTKIKNKTIVRVGNIYFRYEKGKFNPTKFLTRP
ncbi:MAG: hypothetical protein MUF45_08565 [Spirosomaceae bacterium]|jgi:hypothetical protein|nr:hypothetical protein [Spirosomataceae bacterium]